MADDQHPTDRDVIAQFLEDHYGDDQPYRRADVLILALHRAGFGVGEWSGAERDRLQAEKAHLVEINAALRTRPDLAERAPLVVRLAEERDQLRAMAEPLRLMLVSGHRTKEGIAFPEERVNAVRDAVKALNQPEASNAD